MIALPQGEGLPHVPGTAELLVQPWGCENIYSTWISPIRAAGMAFCQNQGFLFVPRAQRSRFRVLRAAAMLHPLETSLANGVEDAQHGLLAHRHMLLHRKVVWCVCWQDGRHISTCFANKPFAWLSPGLGERACVRGRGWGGAQNHPTALSLSVTLN